MNREIEFRAIRVDNGEFVYGFYVKGLASSIAYIVNYASIELTGELAYWEVKPESVGQYTGLRDKDKVKIYEGDIVKQDHEMPFTVEYGIQPVDAFEGIGFNLWSHYGKEQDGTRLQAEIEIIGNVHQNPERLNEYYGDF